jgi:diguanylate cyclase (GGDEF)-like protein
MYAQNAMLAEIVEAVCQGYSGMPDDFHRALLDQRARFMSNHLLAANMINIDKASSFACAEIKLSRRLREIIEKRQLHALFQPVLQMDGGDIIGYEGLIRGPSDSPLHSPMTLFKVARANNLTVEVEHLCRQVVIERFAELALPGKLFLNVSPECMCQSSARHGETLGYLKMSGIDPKRVIIELTENQPTYDYDLMRDAVTHYRDMGFQIAIDDLGEGFSSLRLWSELRPDFVKIDRHFIQSINQDPIKLQFVRSIQEIAEKTGTMVVAEGIETQSELLLVKDLGIKFGQGYHIARPNLHPATMVSAEVASALGRSDVVIYPHEKGISARGSKVKRLLKEVQAVSPDMSNVQVHTRFVKEPSLHAVPVVENGAPIGLITRSGMIDRFARLYQRELYGTKPCVRFMDEAPLIVDKEVSLQDLSQIVVDADSRHLANGFIITDKGKYLGMGTGHDLMREITQLQINAARYANPLTLLPGSVPINEHMDRMLANGVQFIVCYFDIDHFKPFNDVYGYRKGDAIIQLTGKILLSKSDPDRDMVGHIGGDDFIILFQSEDWELRCNEILASFSKEILVHYNENDVERGGYVSEDRRGQKVFHSLATLSIGAVRVEPGQFGTTYHVASVASEAKKQAKKIPGNSLFIDRRKLPAK